MLKETQAALLNREDYRKMQASLQSTKEKAQVSAINFGVEARILVKDVKEEAAEAAKILNTGAKGAVASINKENISKMVITFTLTPTEKEQQGDHMKKLKQWISKFGVS